MAVTLEHNDPDCTGEWLLENWGGTEYFRCPGCGLIAYHCTATVLAVMRDYELGALLAALSRGEA